MKTLRIAAMAAALLACGTSHAQQAASWQDPDSGIEFVWIDKGCFRMGWDDVKPVMPGKRPVPPMPDEMPRHEVCVDGFWLGKLEVTREQWQRVMEGRDAPLEQPRRPASHVSREDAVLFIERINARSGGKSRFRLPTEAEWEYACHAGAFDTPVPQSASEIVPQLLTTVWFRLSMRPEPATRDAGTLAPNAWGLHDMIGNVMEWVEDVYVENGYTLHAKQNPKVTKGEGRWVLRGGSFQSDWWNARCGARKFGIAKDRLPSVGIRLVREADGKR